MTTVIKNTRIIDCRGGIIEQGSIKFDETGILEISEQDLDGDLVVDGAAKTVIPGLIDCHVHLGVPPDSLHDEETEIVTAIRTVAQSQMFLQFGVTTVRNMGTKYNCDLYVRDLIHKGYVKGPRILASGTPICITGGHGYPMSMECDTPEETLKAVRGLIKKGVDVIKLIATGGMATQGSIPNAPQLTEEQMRVACAEAERVGIITGAHCTGLEGAQNAIRAGVRSVEHAQLDEETVAMMREKGTFYCPTIITRARIIHSTAPELQWLRDKAKPGDLERKQKAVRLCHEAGVKIAAATDTTGGLLTPIGVLADEIILYTECGLSISEALQTATKTAAELCKIEDMTGTLTVGKCADLVLLDGNPLENPQTLKNVELTYRNGQLLYKNY